MNMSGTRTTTQSRRTRSSKPKVSPSQAELNSPSPASTTSPLDAPESEAPRDPVKVYVARKKMKVSGKQVMPGDVVEEAQDWLRVESWVRAGFLNEEWR